MRLRRLLQQIHLWVGLVLCLPLVMLGITGSILVFEHELEHLFGPEVPRATASGTAQPIAEILAAARTAAPPGFSPVMFSAPAEPGDPAAVRLAPAGGGLRGPGGIQMLVDPVSLDVLGRQESGTGLLRQIFLLHANLLVRDRSGRAAVGWLGVAMLALGISGLVLWWPRPGRWRAAFSVKRGARGLRLHRDLHSMVGIWSLVVFIMVSFSGAYLAFPQAFGAAVKTIFPARDLREAAAAIRVEPIDGAQPIGADRAVALARAAVPDTRLRSVILPSRPEQPVRVSLVRPGHEPGAPAISIFVDPWSARILEIQDPRAYSTGETILAWQHALHAGHGLGWTWRILVFLSGLLPPLFAVTGTAMWLLKRRARQAQAVRRQLG